MSRPFEFVHQPRSMATSHRSLCYSRLAAFGGSPIPPALEVVMKKTLKIILVVVGVLTVLVLVLPFLIPVNQFRPTIEEKASAALGRKVQLGDISLSLLSGSLSAENLSIGDDPKFSPSPFLTAKSLNVGVEIMPLIFSKTLNVTGVTIAGPQVILLRNTAGQWNYSSLGGSAAKSQVQQAPAARSAGSSNATEFSVKKLTLTDGSIIIGSTNSQNRSTYDHVNVAASDVSLTSKFPVTVTADLPAGGKFKLDGIVGPVDQADTTLTPLDARLNVTSLDLASTGFLDSSAGLGGILDLDSNLSSQGGEAQTKGKVKFSKSLLVAGGSPAGVPVTVNFDTKYNLHRNSGVLNPSTLNIGGAAAHLNGTYESAGEATVVNIKLDAKDMPAKDLEAFLPALGIHLPKGASLQAGTLNSSLNLTGPTNKLVITGNVGLFNGVLAGFDLGSRFQNARHTHKRGQQLGKLIRRIGWRARRASQRGYWGRWQCLQRRSENSVPDSRHDRRAEIYSGCRRFGERSLQIATRLPRRPLFLQQRQSARAKSRRRHKRSQRPLQKEKAPGQII
ncbi:MAG: hypothetical protein DMG53_15250 [Acidobacteria bacterium]|nr:MAG: hypothetical protein DMG53_15250 [Acidobacteriota bacterium]